MKKLFFLALSLLLLCGLLAACGEKEPTPNPVSDFKYEENAEGGITITGMTRTVNSEDREKIVIPSEIDGKSVTEIAEAAFRYKGMVSIYIPDTVVSIGESAFLGCHVLSEVRFSKNLATMGKRAFSDCTELKEVTLPASLSVVPTSAFMASAIESVVFEEGITAIEPYAFYGTPLTSIDIPASIQTIGERAFGDCLYLKSIALHDGLVTIGDYAFGGRVSPSNKLTAVTIPKTVTSMTQDAFFRAALLESLTFEGNAPANYGERFDSELNYTVYYHQSATGFSFPRWNGYSTRVIENKDLTPSLYEGFEYADDGAGGIKIMAYLGDATEVTVPATINGKAVTTIASCCFMDEELVAVTIPNTVKTIEGKAFLNCKELRTVNLSEGLTDIEMQAFCYCRKLEGIVLPGTLKTLGEEAFRYCEALQQITVPASVTTWGFGVFEYSGVKNVTLQEGLATLGEFAFGYSALQAIEIPASITVIPTEAFSGCRELKAVTLHEGLVTIGERAFADTAFTSITLPNTLTTIGNAAFDYAALTSISLPASVKSIGESAFENCKALASVTLNQGLLTIGNCAFQNDKALVEIVIPASVTGINESAFYGCENLAKVKFEGNGPANYNSDAERDHYGYEEYIVYYHQGATGFFTVFDECRYEVAIW